MPQAGVRPWRDEAERDEAERESGGGEAVAVGVADGLGAVAGADLGEHVVDVALYRCLADEQALGDLGVGQAGRDQGEDLRATSCGRYSTRTSARSG
jgi:hypothetical protein